MTAPNERRDTNPRRSGPAAWIIAAALSVIAVTLFLRPDVPFTGMAFAQNALVGSRGIHAFTGQLDRNTWGLFMMDVDAGTIWVYEYLPRKQRLRLVAGRSFMYDRYLENYNLEEPSPDVVKEIVQRERDARSRAAALGAPATSAPAGPNDADSNDSAGATQNPDREPRPPAGEP